MNDHPQALEPARSQPQGQPQVQHQDLMPAALADTPTAAPAPSQARTISPEARAMRALERGRAPALGEPAAGGAFRRLPTAPGALPGLPGTWPAAGHRPLARPNVDRPASAAPAHAPANVDSPKRGPIAAHAPANVDRPASAAPVQASANVDRPRAAEPPHNADAFSNVDRPAAALLAEVDDKLAPANAPAAANVDRQRAAAPRRPGVPVSEGDLPAPSRKVGPRRPMPSKPLMSEEEFAEIRARDIAKMQAAVSSGTAILGGKPPSEGGRKQETAQAYQDRGRQFVEKYRRHTGHAPDAEIPPIDFASWFLAQRQRVKPSTYRSYRQAMLVVLQSMPDQEQASIAVKMIENDAGWDVELDRRYAKASDERAAADREGRDPERRGYMNKEKHFPYEDLEKLKVFLVHKLWSKKTPIAIAWLRASIATGLRPEEWANTEVHSYDVPGHGERVYLYVMNAKATNGRSHGPTRTLEITDCSDASKLAIRQMSEKGREWNREDRFKTEQSQISQMIYRASRAIWKNRRTRFYALYSCRHQFVLNMRAIGVPDAELSAMLGHVQAESQTQHYGGKHKGWDKHRIEDRPRGDPGETSRVRQTIVHADRFAEVDKLLGLRNGRKVATVSSGEALDGVTVEPLAEILGETPPAYVPNEAEI